MTLIISGFMNDESIVFVADSLITTKNSHGHNIKLVDRFRKVIPVGIIIRVPEIDADKKITKFRDVHTTKNIMVAFAGSTLVAQHIINNIQGHFRRLRYVNIGANLAVIPPCDYSKSISEGLNPESFTKIIDNNLHKYLNKNFIANLILHCIQNVIDEGKENIIDEFSAEKFKTNFLVAFTCGETQKNHLFRYTMEFKEFTFAVKFNEIKKAEVGIIGLTKYDHQIQKTVAKNVPKYRLDLVLEEVIKRALEIDEKNNLNEIGYPYVLKHFTNHTEIISMQRHVHKKQVPDDNTQENSLDNSCSNDNTQQ